jgi:hypothetical protein
LKGIPNCSLGVVSKESWQGEYYQIVPTLAIKEGVGQSPNFQQNQQADFPALPLGRFLGGQGPV